MALFGPKNQTNEYKILESFANELDSLLSADKYVSKKDYLGFYNETKDCYEQLSVLEKQKVLYAWCKSNKVDYKKIQEFMKSYDSIESIVKNHNDSFIKTHLVKDKNYLDKILYKDDPNIMLDDEQRRVVLSDEDYTLVVAGAGAGKTTTIEAKVKYLVDKQGINPERILIVSFTRKATHELQERFNRLQIPVEIATFHSIGNTIIKTNEDVRHGIVNNGFMFDVIKDYLLSKTSDESFVKHILLFFASYLNMPFDETNTSLLFKTYSQNNNSTLKSDIKTVLDEYQKEQTKVRKTLNDERVRSIDECRIANFLFINGIDYVYEPVYKYCFKDTIKPYCPDFLIKQDGKEIYLEHFGISESGENSRFTSEELEEYKKHVNDKIKLHREHGTKLIYTFSKYNDGRDLITHLKEEIKKAGISLETKTDAEIYQKIATNAEDKYFNKFIQLVCTFISRFKVNNFTASKFDEWKISVNDERTKLFLSLCYQCYLVYTQALKKENKIDFEDMINDASNVLDKYINENTKLQYDYILVDEYQDISLQRFDLCERLSKASDAKIIAVGDDWQSIYRFSGAKIDLFTKFEDKIGYANILKITKTYRNSQQLIDIAGGFVMENDEQIKKSLRSDKNIKHPVVLVSYDDSYNKELLTTPFARMGQAIEHSLDLIVKTTGEDKTIALIGRYNFDGYNLGNLKDYFKFVNNRVVSKKYPKLKLEFVTAHSSKGLGYDNVIIINGKDDILGFPSKIEDDPVMRLVIKDEEEIDFAEERRLFYVALTRTKNRVFIITPQFSPSKFILEIKDKFTNIALRGTELNPIDKVDARMQCPCCGYPLQRRRNKNFKFQNTIWICSNDPEVCGFMTNDLLGGKMSICKCPECEDGFLIVKAVKKGTDNESRMLGCTNYKADGTGCNAYMMPFDYTTDRSILSVKFYNPNTSLDKIIICGLQIKELIKVIYDTINCNIPNFKMSTYCLVDVLTGNNSKVIDSFKLNSLKTFGIIDKSKKKKLFAIIREMVKESILKLDKDNYDSLSVIKKELSDDEIRNFYSNIA